MRSHLSASRRADLRTPAVLRSSSAATVSRLIGLGAAIGLGLALGLGSAMLVASPEAAASSRVEPAIATGTDESGDQRAEIAGVVVSQTGRRHLGAIVQLYTAPTDAGPERYLRPAYTGVDGRYLFDDLAPGCYRVTVDAPAGTTFGEPGSDRRTGGEDQLACVEAGGSAELRSVTSSAQSTPRSTSVVEIIHLGHHLGQLAPSTMELELAGTTVRAEVGGWARVVAAIEAARPVDAPESTITVLTGGVLASSVSAYLFGGAADAAMIERACFDYLAPSPEDRARADEWATFRRFLDEAPCPITVLDPDGPTPSEPSPGSSPNDPGVVIHPVGSDTVALVALDTGPSAADADDPLATTRARIEALAEQEPSTIVVLSGLGLSADRELAAQLPAIDAIIGSGPDSLLGDLDDLGLGTLGPYPDRAINADGDPVCLGHAGDRTRAVGILRVEIAADGRVVSCGGRIELLVGPVAMADDHPGSDQPSAEAIERALSQHPVLTAVTPDAATSVSLDRWHGVLDLLLDDPVATVTSDRCRTRVPGRSVGLLCGTTDGRVADTTAPRADAPGLVADAFRLRAERLGRPAIALVDSDTVTDAIDAGPLTVVEAYRLLPTGPTLAIADLSGTELVGLLGERIATALSGAPGAYPHASGLRFSPDLTVPDRPRVGPVDALDTDGRWAPIDPSARYRVVVTDDFVTADGSRILTAAAAEGRITRTTIGTAEALLDSIDEVLDREIEPVTESETESETGHRIGPSDDQS